jgi:hypothetical protein
MAWRTRSSVTLTALVIILLIGVVSGKRTDASTTAFTEFPLVVSEHELSTLKVSIDLRDRSPSNTFSLSVFLFAANDATNWIDQKYSQYAGGALYADLPVSFAIPSYNEAPAIFFQAKLKDAQGTVLASTQTDSTPTSVTQLDDAATCSATMPPSVNEGELFDASVTISPSNTSLVYPFLFCTLVDAETNSVIDRKIEWRPSGEITRTWPFIVKPSGDHQSVRLECWLADSYEPRNGPRLCSAQSNTAPVSDAAFPEHDAVVTANGGSLLVNGTPAFFRGVNLAPIGDPGEEWDLWPDAYRRAQFDLMEQAGINAVRMNIPWRRFEPTPSGFDTTYQAKMADAINELAARGIFVTVSPLGAAPQWLWEEYQDHWWTSGVIEEANTRFFTELARWLREGNFSNILYVSVHGEAYSPFDWYDPLSDPNEWGEYPQAGSLAEAQEDWTNWLANRGLAVQPYAQDTLLYSMWAQQRFFDLTAIRAQAVWAGGQGRFLVGGCTGTGGTYDLYLHHPSQFYYLKSELLFGLFDLHEIHSYSVYDDGGYWSYQSGISTNIERAVEFHMPVFLGEVNVGDSIDMADPAKWERLLARLVYSHEHGAAGFTVWNWHDYNDIHMGFVDIDGIPRQVYDQFNEWNAAFLPLGYSYCLDASGCAGGMQCVSNSCAPTPDMMSPAAIDDLSAA